MLRRPILCLLTLGTTLALWLLTSASSSRAQDEAPPSEIRSRTQAFLEDVGAGDVDDAVDELLDEGPLARDAAHVAQLKQGIRRNAERYGTFLRAEAVRIERVGRSVVRCVYFYHCADYPVVWRLVFYRAEESGSWKVISVRYDLDYDALPANT